MPKNAKRFAAERYDSLTEDLGFALPATGRVDAMRDLKIDWKWQGVGQSPEPVVKPGTRRH